MFDLLDDWESGKKVSWSANQHRNELTPGDVIYFRISGTSAGLYGVGEVLSNCYEVEADEFGSWKVDIRYVELLLPPILRKETDSVPSLKKFEPLSGFQGTIREVPDEIVQLIKGLRQDRSRPGVSVSVGTVFANRAEVRAAGLHAPTMAGIYPAGDGARAESIVISGGYSDDRDYGDVIIYTGAGGQSAPGSGVQVADQKIEGANKALVRAQNDGTPIRVIRGSGGDPDFSPVSGYRYDGLYEVRKHWFKRSVDGPLIVQFELVAVDYGFQSIAKTSQGLTSPPSGNASPDRKERRSRSLVRDQANVDWIKNLYDNTCQVCRIQLMTDAGAISIGAHIQGLGKPDNGPDVVENMLCLCHNCHAIFDSGSFYINDDSKTITWLHESVGGETSAHAAELFRKVEHQIGLEYVKHHRLNTAGIAE